MKPVSFVEIDHEAGRHWLSKPTAKELARERDAIRRRNRAKYLAELAAERLDRAMRDAGFDPDEPAWREPQAHAAGIIFQTPSGHMLLMKRRSGVWSIPAGLIEENEDPRHAAHRESAEETGYPGNHEAYKVDERTTNGVHFHTFLQPVSRQFSPILNSEHTESGWFHGFSLPEPLHPGLEATLGAMDEYGDRHPFPG